MPCTVACGCTAIARTRKAPAHARAPVPFPGVARVTYSRAQFIGEIERDERGVSLHARVGRDVEGMDLGIYERAMRLHRGS